MAEILLSPTIIGVVVAPVPYRKILTGVTAAQAQAACTAIGEDYRIPTSDELASIFINKNSITDEGDLHIFSSTKRVYNWGITHWVISGQGEYRHVGNADTPANVLCIKR